MKHLLSKIRAWRHTREQARREQRQLAKIMCLMAAMDAPPDIAANLRRIAREDLS
jgi:hypothetical protein